MQNGFKEHDSTNACTLICMVNETIQYYLQNASNVYATVLDAKQAFGIIGFCKLFRDMMIKRKIPSLVIRLIMEKYEKQSMAIRWNSEYSDSFGVSNGVIQGGYADLTGDNDIMHHTSMYTKG